MKFRFSGVARTLVLALRTDSVPQPAGKVVLASVLCEGTTSVVPKDAEITKGFSPLRFFPGSGNDFCGSLFSRAEDPFLFCHHEEASASEGSAFGAPITYVGGYCIEALVLHGKGFNDGLAPWMRGPILPFKV